MLVSQSISVMVGQTQSLRSMYLGVTYLVFAPISRASADFLLAHTDRTPYRYVHKTTWCPILRYLSRSVWDTSQCPGHIGLWAESDSQSLEAGHSRRGDGQLWWSRRYLRKPHFQESGCAFLSPRYVDHDRTTNAIFHRHYMHVYAFQTYEQASRRGQEDVTRRCGRISIRALVAVDFQDWE